MLQVKGTLLVDYVRTVRSNRDRNWDRWLTPADWEIINGKVLPSQKYPYSFFRNIAFAVFKEIAGGNLETARAFGRFAVRGLLDIYKSSILVPGDPMQSVLKMAQLKNLFFVGGGESKMTTSGPRQLHFEMTLPAEETNEEGAQAFAYQIAGSIEELIEKAGGKKARTKIEKIQQNYDILAEWD